jgi:hypothetical protein
MGDLAWTGDKAGTGVWKVRRRGCCSLSLICWSGRKYFYLIYFQLNFLKNDNKIECEIIFFIGKIIIFNSKIIIWHKNFWVKNYYFYFLKDHSNFSSPLKKFRGLLIYSEPSQFYLKALNFLIIEKYLNSYSCLRCKNEIKDINFRRPKMLWKSVGVGALPMGNLYFPF